MHRLLRLALTALAVLVLAVPATAQEGTIRGVVTEAGTGTPLPGVNVFVDGLRLGSATDVDGAYEIPAVPPGSYTLVATFVGYKRFSTPVTVAAGAVVEQDITLQEDLLGFEEVVVTGQGAAGGQVFRDDDRQDALVATNIAEGTTSFNNAADQTALDFQLTVANYGVYVQENVGYKNRYFIEGALRANANSAFGEEIGLVVYPNIGAAYQLSDEAFWKGSPLLQTLVPSLKLRTNLGFAGNFPTPFANDRLVLATPILGEIAYTFGQVATTTSSRSGCARSRSAPTSGSTTSASRWR